MLINDSHLCYIKVINMHKKISVQSTVLTEKSLN